MRKPICSEEAKTMVATIILLVGMMLLILTALIHSLVSQEIFLKFNPLFNVFYIFSISLLAISILVFIVMASDWDGSQISFDWLFDKE
jgi:polyferredoxin